MYCFYNILLYINIIVPKIFDEINYYYNLKSGEFGNMSEQIVYNSETFRPQSIDEAKKIILTGEEISTTEERWKLETPVISELAARELELKVGELVLDYGCGIGRVAKELCSKGCNVIGVDISPEMRKMAVEYVNMPDKFMVFSPAEFDLLLNNGLQYDGAYAIWVLQHCEKPQDDLARIFRGLRVRRNFFVVNNIILRAIPKVENGQFNWYRDNINIWDMVSQFFGVKNTIPYPPNLGLKTDIYLCRTYLKTREKL